MEIFFDFSPTSSHLHPLQVENCDSNSRLVVDEDDNGKFRLERVNWSDTMAWMGLNAMLIIYSLVWRGIVTSEYFKMTTWNGYMKHWITDTPDLRSKNMNLITVFRTFYNYYLQIIFQAKWWLIIILIRFVIEIIQKYSYWETYCNGKQDNLMTCTLNPIIIVMYC